MTTFAKTLLVSSALGFAGLAQATPPGVKYDRAPSSMGPHQASAANPMGMGHRRSGHQQTPQSIKAWWPEQVDLSRLRQNGYDADPFGPEFTYKEAFSTLNLDAVKADIEEVLTTSQDWWPADYGNYAGLFIRMAWHAAGTYRSGDGRGGADGGQLRLEPLNSWPDNGNLDKARRLLWPVKKKYGASLSWGDLMVLAGNVALENTGFETYGFSGGRADDWEPELVYWGPETKFLTSDKRYTDGRQLEEPLAASEMGLIYVNPEGPNGDPDIMKSANDIRTTFGRMGMNDEETVALIVGGHTLGKAHGAHKADACIASEPAASGVEQQGFGWKNDCGEGKGADTVTSGLEGAWTATPVQWSNNYVQNLYAFEWEKTRSPAGAIQWQPVDAEDAKFVPDAHREGVLHAPVMFTTDLALRYDPEYAKVTTRFLEEPGAMDAAFSKAWFKLTHRDMGPKARYVGADVPSTDLLWQDPLPSADGYDLSRREIAQLKDMIAQSGVSNTDLVKTAWASASTFRDTDYRGGANGARVRLSPQVGWDVNDPDMLLEVLTVLEGIKADFEGSAGGFLGRGGAKVVSLADLIVLGGAVGIERAAEAAGFSVKVPFTPGRVDAGQDQTDVESFSYLRPAADGFRNYMSDRARRSPSEMLIDRADMLTLTVPEMTALVGGMRVLGANAGGLKHGVFTDKPGTLSTDFFVNLLDMSTKWEASEEMDGVFEGRNRTTGDVTWTATEVDLVFGSNSELRAVSEVYAFDGGEESFIEDFVSAWTKVMMLDRFDADEG